MKLSLKHIAIFGQVKVNTRSVDSNVINCTTLLDLYNAGWWVTDRFGTIVTLVKEKKYTKDGFACLNRRIYTDVNLDTLDLLTKQIADAQYEKFKKRLESQQIGDKIRKSKDYCNENVSMSTLPSGNRKSGHILQQTQGKNSGKVSGKKERP